MTTFYALEYTPDGYIFSIIGRQSTTISRPTPMLCKAHRHRWLWVTSRDDQLTVDELIELAQLSKPAPLAFLEDEVEQAERHAASVEQSTRYPDSTEHQRMLAASRNALHIARLALARQRGTPSVPP